MTKQEGQEQDQAQFNLQLTDDTWERLLCSLERLEYVTTQGAKIPSQSATRLDKHPDQGNIQESPLGIELEVQLQISAFKYVVATVRDEAESWLLNDFISWMSARKELPLDKVDDYAIPTLQCIIGEKFSLPEIPEEELRNSAEASSSQQQIPEALSNSFEPSQPQPTNARDLESLGAALHGIDKKKQNFIDNPQMNASRHNHPRGKWEDGMERLRDIASKLNQDDWFNRFVSDKFTNFQGERKISLEGENA